MDLNSLFHTKEPDDVIESCREQWDLSGRFPRPKQSLWLNCPHCSSVDVQLSRMMFSDQPDKGNRYTCDVFFKCRKCSFGPKGFHFGVKIPKRMYEENNREQNHNRYEWRTIKTVWKERGFNDDE